MRVVPAVLCVLLSCLHRNPPVSGLWLRISGRFAALCFLVPGGCSCASTLMIKALDMPLKVR